MRRIPPSITVGGKTQTVSLHLQSAPHIGITAERVAYALGNWLIRGVRRETDGSESMCYIAAVPGLNELVRVAVSMDDERIITAFLDRTATRHWNREDKDYFVRVYQNLEERQ